MALESGTMPVSTGAHLGSLEEERIDSWAVLVVLANRIRRIVLVTVLAGALGVLVALLLRPYYTATAVIMPPQQQSSSLSTLVGQLGSLAGLAGGGGGLSSIKSPADMYIGILETRGIADHLISRFDLRTRYRTITDEDTLAALKNHVMFETGKDGLIHVSVKDRNPNMASALANGYVDELYQVNSRLAITEASQRRVFFDQQVRQEQGALTDAEDALRNAEQKTGAIQPSGQTALILRSIADTQTDLSSKQVQLQAMLTSATAENPQVILLKNEISALQAQLAELENSRKKLQPGNVEIPAGQVPEIALEYARKYRDVRYHELLYETLLKEEEAARIDEAKSAPLIQVVDHATPPDKKSGPSRKLVTIGFTLCGFILVCLWALMEDKLRRMRSVPEQAARLRQLRSALYRK